MPAYSARQMEFLKLMWASKTRAVSIHNPALRVQGGFHKTMDKLKADGVVKFVNSAREYRLTAAGEAECAKLFGTAKPATKGIASKDFFETPKPKKMPKKTARKVVEAEEEDEFEEADDEFVEPADPKPKKPGRPRKVTPETGPLAKRTKKPNIETVFEAFQRFNLAQMEVRRLPFSKMGPAFLKIQGEFRAEMEKLGLAEHIDWTEPGEDRTPEEIAEDSATLAKARKFQPGRRMVKG